MEVRVSRKDRTYHDIDGRQWEFYTKGDRYFHWMEDEFGNPGESFPP